MADCTTQAFNGCNCAPGECRSVSVAMADAERARRTIQAKRNAEIALLHFLAALSVIAFVFCTGYALSHYERQYELQARV